MLLSDVTLEQYNSFAKETSFWDDKLKSIVHQENLPDGNLSRFPYGSNIVYSYNTKLVIKLYPNFYRDEFEREVEVLKAIQNKIKSVEVPAIVSKGELEGWDYLIMSELKGTLLIDLWEELSGEEKLDLSKELGEVIREFHRLPSGHFSKINVNWKGFIHNQYKQMKDNQTQLQQELYNSLDRYVDESYINYTPNLTLLTGEYTPFNLLMNKVEGKWKLTGVIDFADCFLGDPEYDLLGPILFMFNGNKELTSSFLKSYGYTGEELNDPFRKKLMVYTILHRFSNINYYISKNPKVNNIENFEDLSKNLFDF